MLRIAFVSLFLTLSVFGAELPTAVEFHRNGSFRVGGAEFQLQHYSQDWKATANPAWSELDSRFSPAELRLTAVTRVSGVPARITEAVTPLEPGSFRLEYSLSPERTAEARSIHGALEFPIGRGRIFVDGDEVPLPEVAGKAAVMSRKAVQNVRFLLPGGLELTVAGDAPFPFVIQDNRQFRRDTFSCRFKATPDSGSFTRAELKLKFTVTGLRSTPIDLSAAADSGFADDPEGTRGWTRQGRGNDLRALPAGPLRVGELLFRVGEKAIVAAGQGRGFGEAARTLELPPGNKAGAVNLLHAAAWLPPYGQPVGELEIEYDGGARERRSVLAGRDCGNWWHPREEANAHVAWRGNNQQAEVGLYASSFELKGEPRRIIFRAAPEVAWMIAAVTLSDQPFLTPTPGDVTMAADREWMKLDFNRRRTPGGPFDFSRFVDAPAGKYGFVRATPAGTLEFAEAPGRRIRFYGPNLVHSANFPDRETAVELADAFAYQGYNNVRLHHFDRLLLDREAPDSLTFDPVRLDQLDYLIARMKERGVYVTIDLYSIRALRSGDGVTELADLKENLRYKNLMLAGDRRVMANWKEFARRLLTHRNPHTGLTWAEEPAIWCVNLLNEDSIGGIWNCDPESAALFRRNYVEECRRKGVRPGSGNYDDPDFRRFLFECQARCLDEMYAFVRDELKCRSLLTSLNHNVNTSLTPLRARLELVDNHSYFAHPRFPGKPFQLPMIFPGSSAIRSMASTPRNLMPTRVFGKPFIVTEFNYCRPNAWRAEAGPLIGAYAAFQDWDGLCRFAWSSQLDRITKPDRAFSWDAVNDPLDQLSERIAVLLFRRGDVRAAKEKIVQLVPRQPAGSADNEHFSDEFRNLGLIAATGSLPEDAPLPLGVTTTPTAGIRSRWERVNRERIAESSTGELLLDAGAGTFRIDTPRTVAVTLPQGELAAGILRVSGAGGFQTVCVTALDDKPLAASGSLLLFHLTDQSNTGMKLSGDRTLLYDWGKLPMLLRRESAQVALRLPAPLKVTALNADGEVKGEVATEFEDGELRFTIDTGMFPGGVMAYHLTALP